jgi:hypothetical protein
VRERPGDASALYERHVRTAVEAHWPALLASSTCVGLALSNWISVGWARASLPLALGALGIGLLDGGRRIVALGVAIAVVGLWWGSLRLDAIERSVLTDDVGASGTDARANSASVTTPPPGPVDVRRAHGGDEARSSYRFVREGVKREFAPDAARERARASCRQAFGKGRVGVAVG